MKKLILSSIGVVMIMASVLSSRADEATGEGPTPPAPGGTCKAPWTNICYKVYGSGGTVVSTAKGVLHVG